MKTFVIIVYFDTPYEESESIIAGVFSSIEKAKKSILKNWYKYEDMSGGLYGYEQIYIRIYDFSIDSEVGNSVWENYIKTNGKMLDKPKEL